ncbi:SGNH/GDSL hydrolase family protein [Amycolatopsis sp. 195334CR]|uniref:SGNH/GDSL hydrolase family protein n=1 Tax=Amycolatopsis sp. 195334CR TaxID=2814588 RepID=UPI001A8DA315|nr:SGNH/GDSL hydrolase family protein [Amycolatopsis sp. 195334CR]MBN6039453.1 SGNH/GDSL hydrolase family protein [Amycolatopsis sp. 195334CR]
MTATLTEGTDPFCLSTPDAARLLAGAPWRRFAALGDSLAAGTGGPTPGYAPLPWPDRVAAALREVQPYLVYRNTGTVGATTGRTLARQLGGLLAFEPDLVHLSCGANDLWRPELDFAAVEGNLRQLFEAAAGTGARLTTFTLGRAFTVPGVPDFPDRVVALNALTRTIATDHDALVIDMWDHPVNDRPDLLSADGIHFAAAGQAVLAAEVIRALADRGWA